MKQSFYDKDGKFLTYSSSRAELSSREFPDTHTKFKFGDKVAKRSGSSWSGRVCGYYSTDLNPEGYNVESFCEKGSVQIYPAKALDLIEIEE